MSLQVLAQGGVRQQPPTYESLAQRVEQLSGQTKRMLTTANDLKTTPDLAMYRRLGKSMEDTRKKHKNYQDTLSALRQNDASNPLEPQISQNLETIRRDVDKIARTYEAVTPRHKELEEEERRAREEAEEQARILAQKTAEQIEADKMSAELEGLEAGLKDIVEDLTILNDVTQQVDEKLDEQHEQLVHVDETIEEAHEEMVAGNEELEVAEDYQKGSMKCIIIIICIVVGVLVVIGVIIGVVVGVVLPKQREAAKKAAQMAT